MENLRYATHLRCALRLNCNGSDSLEKLSQRVERRNASALRTMP